MVKPEGGTSFCPEVWKEIGLSFPVFLDANGQRYHEPVDFKTIKQLAKSVKTYGVNTAFVITQIEALGRYCLTPGDWESLARACLSPGQYLDWKSYLYDYANIQAAINLASGADPQRHWDADMLLGIGRFALDQIGYPDQVYSQINEIAIKAWKALPNRGAVSGNLTKVLQGSTEPFSDFVARMVESATKVFGDPDTAMPLMKQLVYEQCTKECRTAITPYKHKSLELWMKVCREIGGPLTNVGLAAAMIQLRKKVTADTSFKCGCKGHNRRQCPERSGERGSNRPPQPRLCPRCRKGNHWASECRSVKDLDGRPLATGYGGTQPKNGQRGPCPQGPQIYGALQKDRQGQDKQRPWPSLHHPKDRGEPLKAPQDWTSTPPPDSY
ncbi:igE-binding protein-like [Rattus norvegicus]|uniref:igE-binding protein-like n=1 Tax=Rattus norvegicus TaxID=10116 RepID=UPI002FD83A8B